MTSLLRRFAIVLCFALACAPALAQRTPPWQSLTEESVALLNRDHPRMAESLAGAASIHALLEEYEVAEAFYKRALEIREKSFGQNHPATVRTMEELAGVYFKLKMTAEGEKLEARALDIRTRKR